MTDYPISDIIRRARYGHEAIYPSLSGEERFSIFGSTQTSKPKRFHTLDDIFILPPQYTPLRLQKSIELIYREPYFRDVDTSSIVGGFKTSLPLIQASMGSPQDWNKISLYSAKARGKYGLIMGIGENVATSWGYDRRKDKHQPTLKERILTYFENEPNGIGGVLIQQNEEDAFFELWNKLYSDSDMDQFIQEGRIGFEIKGGQGAKAGIGGERYIDRKSALAMKDNYIIFPDPDEIVQDTYERHSSPDIFTEEILFNRIKKLKNDYPRVKIWFKTAGFRDLPEVLEIADKAGADSIVVDSKEGGTGMAPSTAIQDLGISTLGCIARMKENKKKLDHSSLVISGRIHNGSGLVKSLCLGADAVAMGRPFLISGYSYRFMNRVFEAELYRKPILKKIGKILYRVSDRSETYISNFISTIQVETQLLMSSLGKYYLNELCTEDIGTEVPLVSKALGISNFLEGTPSSTKDTIQLIK